VSWIGYGEMSTTMTAFHNKNTGWINYVYSNPDTGESKKPYAYMCLEMNKSAHMHMPSCSRKLNSMPRLELTELDMVRFMHTYTYTATI
jgi:hypothetical protein